MAYYVFDDAKNLFEGMTKEEIIAAIAQATGVTPENIDDGFITTIQEQNAQHGVKLWVGSQNEYNAIQQPDANTLYIVTDPAETNELQNQINQLQAEVNELAVQNTENASGFKIESQTYTKDVYSTDTSLSHDFTVPLNAVVLEASFEYGGSQIRTDNVYVVEIDRETNKTVRVTAYFEAPTMGIEAHIKLVYAYSEAVDLSELTDIRVGYDGTVYGSAGEAVRKQIFKAGFNEYVKSALLNLLAHVAFIDDDGQQYYNALEAAMYRFGELTNIVAVFNQGNNVIYETDSLDSLRQYLIVTAQYQDGSSIYVTTYNLSGTLEAGTSTITVEFGGKTTTFNVNVTGFEYTGFTSLGTPNISENILTPSASGMILSPAVFSPNNSPWKIRVGFTIGTVPTTSDIQDFIGSVDANGTSQRGALMEGAYYPQIAKYLMQGYLSSNGTSWDISAGQITAEITSNTTCIAELEFTGTQYSIRLSTDGGETWTPIVTSGTYKNVLDSTSKTMGGYYIGVGLKRNGYFGGTIDLKEVKVWIDGAPWWKAIV